MDILMQCQIDILKEEVEHLKKELENYRWREKREKIVKRLRLKNHSILVYDNLLNKYVLDKVLVNLLESGRIISFINELYSNALIDDMLEEGRYTLAEIIDAIKDYYFNVIGECRNAR